MINKARHELREQPLSRALEPRSYNAASIWALSKCFPQLPGGFDAFAKGLVSNATCGDIARRCLHEINAGCGHMAFGAAGYLSLTNAEDKQTLLDKMRQKHVFHVSQENMDADIAAMWDWLCIDNPPPTVMDHTTLALNRSQARHDDTEVSEEGQAALNLHLVEEETWMRAVMSITENPLHPRLTGR